MFVVVICLVECKGLVGIQEEAKGAESSYAWWFGEDTDGWWQPHCRSINDHNMQ